MKTLTDFALKEEYKHLQSVGDKLTKIDSLIDWKLFHIIFESIYFDKTVFWGRPEAGIIIMFKIFVLQQLHGHFDFKMEKQCIDRIQFSNSIKILNSNRHPPAQKPSHRLSIPRYLKKNRIYIPCGKLPQSGPQAVG